MVAPVYTLIVTPNGTKYAWPPRKIPQNDGYVCNVNIFGGRIRSSEAAMGGGGRAAPRFAWQ
jgi:hypothetical protein